MTNTPSKPPLSKPPSSKEEAKRLAARERKRRQTLRDKAVAQGIDPDTVDKKRTPGRPRKENPSKALQRKHRYLYKKTQEQLLRDQKSQEDMLNYLGSITGLTGKKEESEDPKTQEQMLAQAYGILNRQMDTNDKLTAFSQTESQRRLVEAQNATILAQNAGKRDEAALTESQTLLAQQENMGKTVAFIEKLTPGKPKARPTTEEDGSSPMLIEPTPRKQSARKASAKQAVTTPKKKTPAKKKRAELYDWENMAKDALRDGLTAEIVHELSPKECLKALEACASKGLLSEATNPRKRIKLDGDALRAFCERVDDVELNYEDLEDYKVAKLLVAYLNGDLDEE